MPESGRIRHLWNVVRYLARRYRLKEELKQAKAPVLAQKVIDDQAADYRTQGIAESDIAAWKQEVETKHFDDLKNQFLMSNASFVDFCVSRRLGYVFKKVAKSRYEGEKLGLTIHGGTSFLIS